MVVFRPQRGNLEEAMKEVRYFANVDDMIDRLRKEYNGEVYIDNTEVFDPRSSWEHIQYVVYHPHESLSWQNHVIGVCDCKTFEKVSYKPVDENKIRDFSKLMSPLFLAMGMTANGLFGSSTKDAQKESDSEQQKTSDTNVPDELVIKYLRKQNEELMNWIKILNKENEELKKKLADRQLSDRVAKLEQIVSKQAKNKKSNWTC